MILQVPPTRVATRHQPPEGPTSSCEASRLSRQREVQHVSRLRTADHATCESLVEQYSERMLAVARRMLRSEEDAADAVQDAFLAAFVALQRFRGQAQISTWLHRIVVNQCLMKLRSQKWRVTLALDSFSANSEAGDCEFEAVAPCDHTGAELDHLETRLAVRRCIQQLPEDYREILILRDIEEFDTDQTAALLGLSRSAAKTRLHRARQALRATIEQGDFAFA